MCKSIIKGFAAGEEEQIEQCVNEGWHKCAKNMIKQEYTKKATRVKVRRNPLDRTKQIRASIITRILDERMQASIEKERAIYYKDQTGIDMPYPHGSKLAKLSSLHVVSNNSCNNNFNLILGCKKSNQQELTFIALKVSEGQKNIEPETRMIFDIALQGMLKNKPSVIRGALRNGVTQQYVCHGFRKNPLDRDR